MEQTDELPASVGGAPFEPPVDGPAISNETDFYPHVWIRAMLDPKP